MGVSTAVTAGLSAEELALHAQMELPGSPEEVAANLAVRASHALWATAERCEHLAERLRVGDHETKRALLEHAGRARRMSRLCGRIACPTGEREV
jgi:hypothetical protein